MNRNRRADRTRRRPIAVAVSLALVVVAAMLLAVSGLTDTLDVGGAFRRPAPIVEVADDPYTDRPLHVDPSSQTARAAMDDDRFVALAATPQAKWFTDWTTAETIEAELGTYLAGAGARQELAVAVLYRIPERDCGSHAAGGAADHDEYRAWIDGAARALEGQQAIVVLEPDAVGQLDKCTTGRAELLRYASDRLGSTGAWVYIDGGHSRWVEPDEMAERLQQVGIEHLRGFTTNVANFRATEDEREYGEQVVAELTRLGIEEKRFVIDTGRNGGEVSDDEWCNPPGARLGRAPALLFDGAWDAALWIKSPAESDGTCHGGPRTGFYDQLALMLMGEPNAIERRASRRKG
ncbi:glycoside hydrolase family 6 protein [Nocardioides sp. zg-536]|uniref:Glucanase n=1 Tax=Nocardioides faecalis TaxID=2803858 RepID=A0A939BZU6_9ACTN|nr:glycoside hydrolase family 6 protein [Nocardioides faecalis]MBM9461440.1 glycoside hydrolase family 6 protein [Nocardioides faecalis]MBS4751768.1 glycoside hydrolase family 6 protein [Nocardioides faecalis]QVI59371.1 glycoside hydrolase family 6 protein [Nocardioides faecalis]